MPGSEPKDKYSNLIQVTMEESAANTLTFGAIDLGLTIFQKVGIIVNRIVIDWTTQVLSDFVNDDDSMTVALTQSDQISTLALTESAVIWKAQRVRFNFGTPANSIITDVQREYSFEAMPGGGELMAPRPLYWACKGNGMSATFAMVMRIYFRILELKADEYFEILESRRFFG